MKKGKLRTAHRVFAIRDSGACPQRFTNRSKARSRTFHRSEVRLAPGIAMATAGPSQKRFAPLSVRRPKDRNSDSSAGIFGESPGDARRHLGCWGFGAREVVPGPESGGLDRPASVGVRKAYPASRGSGLEKGDLHDTEP